MSLFCGYSHSSTYATYRPTYPLSLFENLAALTPSKGLAWDIACGTGQATSSLAQLFSQVIGTDLSQSQLNQAKQLPNTLYIQCSAEEDSELIESRLSIKAGSVDLITVAQAAHWFNLDKFYDNVKHFLSPTGIIAMWTYTWPVIQDSPELSDLLVYAAKVLLAPFWAPERQIVDDQYRSISFPFEIFINATDEPYQWMETTWTVDSMLGYIQSWSAYQTALKTSTDDPIEAIRDRIVQTWGTQKERPVRFPIFLLAGRK